MPHVMGDHEFWGIVPVGSRQVSVHIAIKAGRRAHEGEVVHHVAADRRVRRRAQRIELPGFTPRAHDANGPAAHPARAKLEIAVKAVVELAPCSLCDELPNRGGGPCRQAGLKPGCEILHSFRK